MAPRARKLLWLRSVSTSAVSSLRWRSASHWRAGCAVLAAQAYLYASAPGLYPVSIRGMGTGSAVAAGRVGSIIGPQLGGILKSAGHDTPHLLMDILPLVIAGSVASLAFAWITRRRP